MAKEFIRMQKLAGLITESQYKRKLLIENQISEGEIGGIDVDLVKSYMDNPYVKKIAQQLKADPNLLRNAVKFIADKAGDETILEEEDYGPNVDKSKPPMKEKLKTIAQIAGVGATIGGLFGMMLVGPGAEDAVVSSAMVVSALTAAVASVGLGAIGTDGRFNEDLEGDSVEDTIKQILDIGKKL